MAENINLPNSLLSRFDLMFLLLDTPEIEGDVALARHVTHVHSHLSNPKLDFLVFGADFLAQYIAQARQFEPLVPRNLSSTIIETYVAWRQRSVEIEQGSMTPRQLLSILGTIILIKAQKSRPEEEELVILPLWKWTKIITVVEASLYILSVCETLLLLSKAPKSASFSIWFQISIPKTARAGPKCMPRRSFDPIWYML